jgi:diguanylate cyclase (GGDEF)-like protein
MNAPDAGAVEASEHAALRADAELVLLYAKGTPDGRVLSGSLMELLGVETQADWLAAVHPDDRERVSRALQGGMFGAPFDIRYRLSSIRPGHMAPVHDRVVRIASHGVLRIVSHIEAQPGMPAATGSGMAQAPILERRMLNALPDVLLVVGRDITVQDVFGPVQQMVAEPHDLIGRKFIERPEITTAVAYMWTRHVARALDSGRSQLFEYSLTTLSGDRDFEARVVPLSRREASVIVRDVSERNRLRERFQHLASHDDLTGLLTRSTFIERLDALLQQRPEAPLAILSIDLDRFKQLNDTFGSSIGDTLLKVVSNRLTRRASGEALRARLSADEFALALEASSVANLYAEIDVIVQTLLSDIGNRMRVHGESLYLTASIGIALVPVDGSDAATLLRNADVAMMRAKERGGNGLQFYDAEMGEAVSSSFNVEQSLRRAVVSGELICLFQPKIDVQGSVMRGVEALVRWPVSSTEMLAPDRFIPLAERTGLIVPLGQWVMAEAIKQVCALQAQRGRALDLAVNVSITQLRQAHFAEEVRELLRVNSFSPSRLTLEIAETALHDDLHAAIDTLAELAGLGVRIAIDDFGTGYGGLSWLKSLPVHEIKIDRSFIKGCAIDAFDAAIVSGLVDIAHNLGIRVVAEGVERADQIAFLTQVQCDSIQGYFLGMPMSAAELGRVERLWQGS